MAAGLFIVPLGLGPSVRRPHFHEPLDGHPVAPPPLRERMPVVLVGQLSFPFRDLSY